MKLVCYLFAGLGEYVLLSMHSHAERGNQGKVPEIIQVKLVYCLFVGIGEYAFPRGAWEREQTQKNRHKVGFLFRLKN